MILKRDNRVGGGSSSGLYTLGCVLAAVLAVCLAGCSSPAPAAGPATKPQVSASVAAAPESAPAATPRAPGATQAAAPAAVPTGNVERGQELYESRCFACHSIEANRVGPRHEGLFGRMAGKLRDYDYSAAVKASKIVWNEKTLDAWLSDPQALIPGQKMNYAVTDPTARADIIAYLKAATAK